MSCEKKEGELLSMRYRTTARAALAAGLSLALLAGCFKVSQTAVTGIVSGTTVTTASESASSGDPVTLVTAEEAFSDRDFDASYDEAAATAITLSDGGSSVSGSGATVSGSTITITEAGVYVVSGSLSDGQIVVDAADDAKVQIVLAGATVEHADGAALLVKSADKVFLTLADGTENALATTGSFTDADEDENVDSCIFSKADLTIQGTGALSVTCAEGHGIVSKDELTVTGGEISVESAGHALQAKDSLAVGGGTLTLAAGTDALHCENDEDTEKGWIFISGGTITAEAASDGVDAGNFLEIDGGTLEISAGDDGLHAEYGAVVNGGTIAVTQSYEALEGSYVTVTGGTLSLVSSDDGINAAGEPTEGAGTEDAGGMAAAPSIQDSGNASGGMPSASGGQSMGGADTAPSGMAGGGADGMEADDTASVTITGGTIEIVAGCDGIDSNGDLTIEGGAVYVSGPEDGGNGSLDYAGTGMISGGALICAGSAGMAQTLEAGGSQGVAMVSLSGSAGDTISITDSAGTVLASMAVKASYECVIVSCSGMVEDGTYSVTNGSDSVEVTLDGLSYSESGTFGGGGMGQEGGIPSGMGGDRGASGGAGSLSTQSTDASASSASELKA